MVAARTYLSIFDLVVRIVCRELRDQLARCLILSHGAALHVYVRRHLVDVRDDDHERLVSAQRRNTVVYATYEYRPRGVRFEVETGIGNLNFYVFIVAIETRSMFCPTMRALSLMTNRPPALSIAEQVWFCQEPAGPKLSGSTTVMIPTPALTGEFSVTCAYELTNDFD